MNWLRRWLGRGPRLHPEQSLALAAYRAQPVATAVTPLATLRFIVADVETTGLSPYVDRLISIGAVEVSAGKVRLGSGFEVVFRQPQASANANILIHGIDGTTQIAGLEPAAAMLQFLDYAEQAPLVGFHADFDRVMIDRASSEVLGYTLSNTWLDLAYLAPALLHQRGTALPQSLDEWTQLLGIENHARHNALADAVATAQLLQVVLARAIAAGTVTLADLLRLEKDQRWLSQR
ncbi:MAG: 3'-5' exonuclease [Betaproteobacteria bacterium]|nr:MAG: 3'-5' exonuclease [Betaproteobacteria bacterium]